MDLPADLQLLVLAKMDLHTLQSITHAIPEAKNL
jgi:hypothetical protein